MHTHTHAYTHTYQSLEQRMDIKRVTYGVVLKANPEVRF